MRVSPPPTQLHQEQVVSFLLEREQQVVVRSWLAAEDKPQGIRVDGGGVVVQRGQLVGREEVF